MNDDIKIPIPPLPVRPSVSHPSAVSVVRPPSIAEMKRNTPPSTTTGSDLEDGWEFIDGEGWQRKADFPPMPEFIMPIPTPEQRLRSEVRDASWDVLSKRSGVPVKKIESFAFYRSVPKQKVLDALADALGVARVPVVKDEVEDHK